MTNTDTPSFLKRLLPARLVDRPPVVAVVRLAGVISARSGVRPGLCLEQVNPQLEKAFKVKRLAAVALAINSPGGSPVQSALIHDRIRQLAEKHETQVLAFCEDVAASGGYWLATAGDEIHVHQTSIVGSIGVITAGFGFVDAIKKLGVERRVHTAGENKSILDPFQPEKRQDVARLKDMQLDMHDVFKTHVRARRAGKLNENDTDLFTGAFWSGNKAVELGLADSVGTMHDVLTDRFGEDVKIRPVKPSGGLSLKRLFGAGGGAITTASGQPLLAGLSEDLLEAAESRALWQRFGL